MTHPTVDTLIAAALWCVAIPAGAVLLAVAFAIVLAAPLAAEAIPASVEPEQEPEETKQGPAPYDPLTSPPFAEAERSRSHRISRVVFLAVLGDVLGRANWYHK